MFGCTLCYLCLIKRQSYYKIYHLIETCKFLTLLCAICIGFGLEANPNIEKMMI